MPNALGTVKILGPDSGGISWTNLAGPMQREETLKSSNLSKMKITNLINKKIRMSVLKTALIESEAVICCA